MWGKPGDTQPTQTPSQHPANGPHGNSAPAGTPAPSNAAPASRPPVVTSQPVKSQEGPTVFGKTMKIIGDVSCDEELYVDGELEGRLDLKHRLTIGPESKVKG